MTTNHHTALTNGQDANAATFNAPLSSLDSVITDILDGTQAFTQVRLNGNDTTNRAIRWTTSGSNRWFLEMVGSETGSDDGSNWSLSAYDDSGSLLGEWLRITRSVGQIQLRGSSVRVDGNLDHDGSRIGFYNTATQTQQTVTGSRGGNAALASLLTALDANGLIVDNSS